MNVPALKFEPEKTVKIELATDGGCNTPDDVILDQVRENIRRGLPQVFPHQPNPLTAILVCGGPSLAETEKELVKAVWEGGKVVAVNGAYQWCIDHNIKPSAAVMLDAREFNARFIEEPVDGCKYLLASQCHAKTFDLCHDRETVIWHACSGGEPEVELLKEYYFGEVYPVTLGTTVGIRAISLMRMLGFTNFEIFGLDSCWLDKKHHAYEQAENNRDGSFPVWLKPDDRIDLVQRFICAPWHIKQSEDFQNLIRERGNLFQLNVHGPGLLASILRTGAKIQIES